MKKLCDILTIVGGLTLVVGAMLVITRWPAAPWIYLAGAVLFAVMLFIGRYRGDNFIVKRLQRQQLLGALFFIVAGVLMLTLHHNEWIVALLIATLFLLYPAFRMPRELEKEKQS